MFYCRNIDVKITASSTQQILCDCWKKRFTISQRKEWANKVVKALTSIAPVGTEFILFGGKCYREFIVEPLTERGYSIRLPLKGLGIGKQLHWLKWQISNLTAKTIDRITG